MLLPKVVGMSVPLASSAARIPPALIVIVPDPKGLAALDLYCTVPLFVEPLPMMTLPVNEGLLLWRSH